MWKSVPYTLLLLCSVGQFTDVHSVLAIQDQLPLEHEVLETDEDLPSAKTIIANYYESIGGEMALDGIDSLTFDADFVAHGASRTDGKVNLRWTKDGWHYQFNTGTTDTTYWKSKGEKYWKRVRGTPSAMTTIEKIKFLEILPVPMHAMRWQEYKDVESTIVVHGLVNFRDAICYQVEFKPAEGNPIQRYFEKESGRLVKLEYLSEGTQAVWVLSDYQEVEEVWIPMRRENYFSGTLEYEVVKKEVEIGVAVDEKWFVEPDLESDGPVSDDPFGGGGP